MFQYRHRGSPDTPINIGRLGPNEVNAVGWVLYKHEVWQRGASGWQQADSSPWYAFYRSYNLFTAPSDEVYMQTADGWTSAADNGDVRDVRGGPS